MSRKQIFSTKALPSILAAIMVVMLTSPTGFFERTAADDGESPEEPEEGEDGIVADLYLPERTPYDIHQVLDEDDPQERMAVNHTREEAEEIWPSYSEDAWEAQAATDYRWYIGSCKGTSIMGVPGVCGTNSINVLPNTYLVETAAGDIYPAFAMELFYEASGDFRVAVGHADADLNAGVKLSGGTGVVWATIIFADTPATQSIQCDGTVLIRTQTPGTLGYSDMIFNVGDMDFLTSRFWDPFTVEATVRSASNFNQFQGFYVDACNDFYFQSDPGRDLTELFILAELWLNIKDGSAQGTDLDCSVLEFPEFVAVIENPEVTIGGDGYPSGWLFHVPNTYGFCEGEVKYDTSVDIDLFASFEAVQNLLLLWRGSSPYFVLGPGMAFQNSGTVVDALWNTPGILPDCDIDVAAERISSARLHFDNSASCGAFSDNTVQRNKCATAFRSTMYQCNLNDNLFRE